MAGKDQVKQTQERGSLALAWRSETQTKRLCQRGWEAQSPPCRQPSLTAALSQQLHQLPPCRAATPEKRHRELCLP